MGNGLVKNGEVQPGFAPGCNKLTDYWHDHEIKGEKEFAILTNIIQLA